MSPPVDVVKEIQHGYLQTQQFYMHRGCYLHDKTFIIVEVKVITEMEI